MTVKIKNDMTDLVALDLQANGYKKIFVDLKDVLVNKPPFVTLVVNNRFIDQTKGEEHAAELEEFIHQNWKGEIEIRKHVGGYDSQFVNQQHVLLVITTKGWYVDKARGTVETVGQLIPIRFGNPLPAGVEVVVYNDIEVSNNVPMTEMEKDGIVKQINDQVGILNHILDGQVHISELLEKCTGRSVLIQRINDPEREWVITSRVLDLMRDIFKGGAGYKVTVIQLDDQQKGPVSDYLTNCIVLTVYPGCVVVDKARGTTCEFEGKCVTLSPSIMLTRSQYKLLTGKDIHKDKE